MRLDYKYLDINHFNKIKIPLFISSVQAGFPSPADDYKGARVFLKDLVVTNENSTFFIRVKGNSMIEAGIQDEDILVVDKSITPKHGDIVIALINAEFTVKVLYLKDKVIKLQPANPLFKEITFKDFEELKIWGVVTHTIHKNK